MYNLPESAILYANSAHGVYIPQYFAESINRYVINLWSSWIDDLDSLCLGPDNCEDYWEIWEDMLNRLVICDPDTGIEYYLYQDGDLWLVPVDYELEESE